MLSQLRRAALLAGYAAAGCRLPPAAVSAATAAAEGTRLPVALQQAWRSYSSSSGGGAPSPESMVEYQVQPFSVALRQLEAMVTEQVLPQDALAANSKAMATLREFAKGLEPSQGYPAATVKNVQFVFRDPYSGGRLQKVRCQLKTTGGNCSQLVQQSLGQLLQRMGLNPYFFFDGDQFRPRPQPRAQVVPKPKPAVPPPAATPTPEHVQSVRARAAAAGFPSQTISEEQFKQMEAQSEASRQEKAKVEELSTEAAERMKKIDPLLAAVAALPWLTQMPDAVAQEKVKMIKSKVMDEIESWGWDVRGPVRRIWAGERSVEALLQGKDAGSREAIKAILYHAIANDKKYGLKKLRPSQAV